MASYMYVYGPFLDIEGDRDDNGNEESENATVILILTLTKVNMVLNMTIADACCFQ